MGVPHWVLLIPFALLAYYMLLHCVRSMSLRSGTGCLTICQRFVHIRANALTQFGAPLGTFCFHLRRLLFLGPKSTIDLAYTYRPAERSFTALLPACYVAQVEQDLAAFDFKRCA